MFGINLNNFQCSKQRYYLFGQNIKNKKVCYFTSDNMRKLASSQKYFRAERHPAIGLHEHGQSGWPEWDVFARPEIIGCTLTRLAAGPLDRRTKKTPGLVTKLLVLWQWTGHYFEHWLRAVVGGLQ